jgi:antiviral helicase SKI2
MSFRLEFSFSENSPRHAHWFIIFIFFPQGKPTKLESQFRLTYSMILNLLRVEKLRVQDMMKRSFSEINAQKNVETNKKRLEELKEKLSKIEPVECFMCSEDLENYYSTCAEYGKLKSKLQVNINS